MATTLKAHFQPTGFLTVCFLLWQDFNSCMKIIVPQDAIYLSVEGGPL